MTAKIMGLTCSIIVFFICIFIMYPLSIAGEDYSVFVSPAGSDENSGTPEAPFATFIKARNVLRSMKTDGIKKIIVLGGRYYGVELVLEKEDSGVVIEAQEGGKPILYGGRVFTNWEKDGDRFFAAYLPGVKEGKWDFRSLIVNDEHRLRARYPDTGALGHRDEFRIRWMSTTGDGWERKPTNEELTTMHYQKNDIGPWLDNKNAELTVYHQWDESMVGIKSLDDATQTVIFSTPAGHPPGAFYWSPKAKTYVVWNIGAQRRRHMLSGISERVCTIPVNGTWTGQEENLYTGPVRGKIFRGYELLPL